MKIAEIKNRYADVLDDMTKLAEAAKKEERLFSPEEKEQLSKLETEEAELRQKIADYEAQDEEQRQRLLAIEKLNESRGKNTGSAEPKIRVTREEGTNEKGDCIVWRSLGEQLMAVKDIAKDPHSDETRGLAKRMAQSNRILRSITGMSESVMADGGDLVQTEASNELRGRAYETGKLSRLVTHYSLGSSANSMSFPYVAETSRADGSRSGGVRAYWQGEAAQYTASRPKVERATMTLRKLTGLCYMTDELLEDASVLEQFVKTEFGKEFGFKIDDAIVNGNGADKPLGILNAPALVTQTKESGQAANTIVAANLAKMLARLFDPTGALWIYNYGCKAQLMTLSLTIGSNTYPMLIPGGVTGSMINGIPTDTILGYPAIAVEQCAALSSLGDIILWKPADYIWMDKGGGVKQDSSIHVRFEYGEQVFRFTTRADGAPAVRSALTPFKGSATLSSYVVLEAR